MKVLERGPFEIEVMRCNEKPIIRSEYVIDVYSEIWSGRLCTMLGRLVRLAFERQNSISITFFSQNIPGIGVFDFC